LLSPQHRSQVAKDNFSRKRGTWYSTYDDAVELYWDQRRYKRTILLNEASNIALIRSAPVYTKFHAFCHNIDEIKASPLVGGNEFYCFPAEAPLVSDDKDETSDEDDESKGEEDWEVITSRRYPDIPDEVFAQMEESTPPTTAGPATIPEDEDVQQASAQAELLAWHYQLGNVPFAKVQQMAARGDLSAN
jgi:hypothetical protein